MSFGRRGETPSQAPKARIERPAPEDFIGFPVSKSPRAGLTRGGVALARVAAAIFAGCIGVYFSSANERHWDIEANGILTQATVKKKEIDDTFELPPIGEDEPSPRVLYLTWLDQSGSIRHGKHEVTPEFYKKVNIGADIDVKYYKAMASEQVGPYDFIIIDDSWGNKIAPESSQIAFICGFVALMFALFERYDEPNEEGVYLRRLY